MSGVQEILTIAAIVLGIIFIPRFLPGKKISQKKSEPKSLSFNMRLAIAASLILPVVAAAVLKPWKGELVPFVFIGLGPVAAGWLIGWVFAARKKS